MYDDKVAPAVSVIGTGYVGTVIAACLAKVGRCVVGLERDEQKLRTLQGGRAPFYEPGLDELLLEVSTTGRLRFTCDVEEAMSHSEVVFLCVGTPKAPDGGVDLRFVAEAARQIGRALKSHHVLVTNSTVPIGCGGWLASIIEDSLTESLEADEAFSVVSNPEFLREGNSISDFLYPERIVIGGEHRASLDKVCKVYQPIIDQSFPGGDETRRPALVSTSLATAEMVKYASNAFLATKVSFINEVANICELVGAEVNEVAAALGFDSRIGRSFLNAGIGWGGSCFGKDLSALIYTAGQYGYEANLLRAAAEVNTRQRLLIVEKLRRHLKVLLGQRIALLGLAFKPGTDDLRDSPAVDVARSLIQAGAIVTAHDPLISAVPSCPDLRLATDPYTAADRANAVVLATEWPDYADLDFEKLAYQMRGNLLVDGRNYLNGVAATAAGFVYEAIGHTAGAKGGC